MFPLQNFWDGDASEKQPAAINSSCVPQLHLHEKGNNSSSAAIATASSFLLCKKFESELTNSPSFRSIRSVVQL